MALKVGERGQYSGMFWVVMSVTLNVHPSKIAHVTSDLV